MAWASGPLGRPPVGLLRGRKGTLVRGQRRGRRPRHRGQPALSAAVVRGSILRARVFSATSRLRLGVYEREATVLFDVSAGEPQLTGFQGRDDHEGTGV